MDIKHICFIADGYPTTDDMVFTFFRQLVCAIADTGVKCTVIVPQSVSRSFFRSKKKRPLEWIDISNKGFEIDVYQPKSISFSNRLIFGVKLGQFFWRQAVIHSFDNLKIKPCAVYGHFWHCGLVASIIGKKYHLPVFVASGESKIAVKDRYSNKMLLKYLDAVRGVICVSSKNMKESLDLNLASPNKMIVIPNAINSELFYFENKLEQRKNLGFDKNDFIIAFTGWFNERKGVLRLSEAIGRISDVKSIYIGSGELQPYGDNILFCGKLPHDQIVHYLNAADIFVLPTLAEGCCNAIIEAMACGLPIISSNLPFNDDILNTENSIRIDPKDVEAIKKAIILLKDNPDLRSKMSKAALISASNLKIEQRAKKIIEFMNLKNKSYE